MPGFNMEEEAKEKESMWGTGAGLWDSAAPEGGQAPEAAATQAPASSSGAAATSAADREQPLPDGYEQYMDPLAPGGLSSGNR